MPREQTVQCFTDVTSERAPPPPVQALQQLATLAPPGLLDAATIESLVPVLDQLDLVLR